MEEQPKSQDPPIAKPCPIVGIGASAGGLEALQDFLSSVPESSGLAYVIVQHMPPDRKSAMAHVLQNSCRLRIQEVQNHMTVEPDHVYLIPAGKDLELRDGTLYLSDPKESRGLRLPIDHFFKSLAFDLGSQSIGVVLSGMGADGTLGLLDIKQEGGLCLVQIPSSAKFSSMPEHALEKGVADFVGLPSAMPAQILNWIAGDRSSIPPLAQNSDQKILDAIIALLLSRKNQDFTIYKISTISRRIERRMKFLQLTSLQDYYDLLCKQDEEIDRLSSDLLIGVTSFFRDPPVWEYLKHEILPMLLKGCSESKSLRAWVPGCSTGEEVYSLAMTFQDVIASFEGGSQYKLRIFATDIDQQAIARARVGQYSKNSAAEIPAEQLQRYFQAEAGGYKIKKEIRDMVIFSQQNLALDPPFVKLDFLSCRNVFIYFNSKLQKRLVELFYYSLNPGGVLLLGNSETIGSEGHLFSPLGRTGRFYCKVPLHRPLSLDFPPFFHNLGDTKLDENKNSKPSQPLQQLPPPIEALAGRLILQDYAPAAVLATEAGEILFISGRTGRFLEPPVGKADWSLFALGRQGLKLVLNDAFYRAVREKRTVSIPNVKVGSEHDITIADVTVQPLFEPEGLKGLLLVVFTDTKAIRESIKDQPSPDSIQDKDEYIAQLLNRLQAAEETIQMTRHDMQLSQEELKLINEELQAANEELQSTNEELMTSKEEVQSMNEELQTVNHELQAKVDELSYASNDMKNLLNSTDIATLFLDEKLNIRRFTAQAASVIRLIPSDSGRPVTDLVSSLDYPQLTEDTRVVMETLTTIEKQIATRDGRWYNIRIMPYRTVDNRIDGVVITFVNITIAKELEARLRDSEQVFSHAFQNALGGMAFVSQHSEWLEVNQTLCQLLGYTEDELRSIKLLSLVKQEEQGAWQEMMEALKQNPNASSRLSFHFIHKSGRELPMQIKASVLPEGDKIPFRLLLQFSL